MVQRDGREGGEVTEVLSLCLVCMRVTVFRHQWCLPRDGRSARVHRVLVFNLTGQRDPKPLLMFLKVMEGADG